MIYDTNVIRANVSTENALVSRHFKVNVLLLAVFSLHLYIYIFIYLCSLLIF